MDLLMPLHVWFLRSCSDMFTAHLTFLLSIVLICDCYRFLIRDHGFDWNSFHQSTWKDSVPWMFCSSLWHYFHTGMMQSGCSRHSVHGAGNWLWILKLAHPLMLHFDLSPSTAEPKPPKKALKWGAQNQIPVNYANISILKSSQFCVACVRFSPFYYCCIHAVSSGCSIASY